MKDAVKISRIDIFSLRIPLQTSLRNSRQARDWQDSIVLQIQTEEGLSGQD
jgi:hypothetical protein